jgi:hypothetical protein
MSNHSFDADIATEYHSVDIAIMVWHFQYWIRKNKALGTNLREGRTWTYQTYSDILANFPYWSYDQVKRLLRKCFDLGIIVKGNFNADKDDKTIWYAFSDEEKFGISKVEKREDFKDDTSGIGRNRPIDRAKSPDRSGEIARSYKDTDTLTDTLKDDVVLGKSYEQKKNLNPKSANQSVKKSMPNGQEIECSLSDYYAYCARTHKPWKAYEIEDAWPKFVASMASVNHWEKYLDQIITNSREEKEQKCLKNKMKEEKNKKREEKKQPENFKSVVSEKDIKEPHSANAWWEEVMKALADFRFSSG